MRNSGIKWIGEIPDNWKIIRLKDWCTSKKEIAGERSGDFERLALTLNGVIKRAKDDSEGLQPKEFDTYQILEANDFVFKMIDLQNISTSRVGLSPYTGLVSPAYIRFAPRHQGQFNDFIYYYLMSLYYNCVFNSMGGDGVRSALNATDMGNFKCPFPDMDTQRKIVAFIKEKSSRIDALIEVENKQIEKLKEYKQAVITEAVTKGLDRSVPMKDSEVEWIGDIPKHWVVIRFKQIATIKTNLVSPFDYLSYPQVSPENIEKGSGKLLACATVGEVGVESNNHLFKTGQIIYSKIRPCLNKVTIAPFDGLCSADMYPIETTLNVRYLLYLMLSNLFLSQVKLVTENRVKMPKINQEEIAQILLCCAPYDEQQEIASYLDSVCSNIDNLINSYEKKIEKLNEYKKSIIYEYVTGKKEVV